MYEYKLQSYCPREVEGGAVSLLRTLSGLGSEERLLCESECLDSAEGLSTCLLKMK